MTVFSPAKALRLGRAALVAGLASLAVLGAGVNNAAQAQGSALDTIYGFTSTNAFFSFNGATPGTVTNLGTVNGFTGQLLDIDFRPANGLLYGLTLNAGALNIYTISLTSGAATFVSTVDTSGRLGGTANAGDYDIDFNPAANALRIIGSNNENYRITGPGLTGTILDGDVNDQTPGNTPNIVGVAYTNSVPGATSTALYDIGTDGRYYQQNANVGTLTQIGGPNATVGSNILSFDISGVSGTGYVVSNNTLYTVVPTTGVFSTGTAITGVSGVIRGISANTTGAPEPGTFALLGTGLVSMGGIAVRRRKAKKA